MTAILVTGGAGYIGSHTCKVLAAAGYTPVAYDNLSRGHREAVKWGPLEVGDLADSAAISAVIRRYRPTGVIHFAAFAYIAESMEHPAMYFRNNVAGSLGLLEAMLRANLKRIVFSSTCATYGVPRTRRIKEHHPQHPINPYGASKLMVEQMLRAFGDSAALEWIALRYFNAAGADPEGEIGEHHAPEPHLIPSLLAAAAGDAGQITVHGTDYPTADGTCVRDYIHVMDLATAHVKALQWLEGGGESMAVNLGTGRGFSVLELVRAVEQATGRSIQVHSGVRRPGDPAQLVSDASLARKVLGWRPSYANIETQILDAWSWYQRLHGRAESS